MATTRTLAKRSPSTSPIQLPEAEVRRILKAVLATPLITGILIGKGANRAKVEADAMQKLAPLVMQKATPKAVAASARIKALEARLAKANPLAGVALRKKIAFARLEAGL